jgi:hypothetical protein
MRPFHLSGIIASCLALAACQSGVPAVDGLVYVQAGPSQGDMDGDPKEAVLLDATGEKTLLGSFVTSRAADDAYQLYKGSLYFVDSDGNIAAMDTQTGKVQPLDLLGVDDGNYVKDFRIASDGTIFALLGVCSQEVDPYHCDLYQYSSGSKKGELLHSIEDVSLWGGASLESVEENSVTYELILNEGGGREYYKFTFADKKSHKVYESRCNSYENPCTKNDFGSGFIPSKGIQFDSCGEVKLSSSDSRYFSVETTSGTLERSLSAENIIGCLKSPQ